MQPISSSRRLASVAALLATMACATASAQGQETIKVGVLISYSGISAVGGQSADNVMKLFQKKYGSAPEIGRAHV